MQGHVPTQAILRVNWAFRDRPGGLAVDRRGPDANARRLWWLAPRAAAKVPPHDQ
jgi:hypothetical protein